MISRFLQDKITSGASYVDYGYAQVEPNHLSAQRTGQIYAQLPAKANIDVLENGEFVKYDYANGEVNFTGKGEWMLVYNEIKLYRDGQQDCEFAMVKDKYNARVYSPVDGEQLTNRQGRFYNGKFIDGQGNEQTSLTIGSKTIPVEDVTAMDDGYEPHYNENPFGITHATHKKMPAGTTMVPRVFKTNVGDIFTTNAVNVAESDTTGLALGDILHPEVVEVNNVAKYCFLAKYEAPAASGEEQTEPAPIEADDILWQIVKLYTLPDGQKAVKVMRIK